MMNDHFWGMGGYGWIIPFVIVLVPGAIVLSVYFSKNKGKS
jgi:hypothetical protein